MGLEVCFIIECVVSIFPLLLSLSFSFPWDGPHTDDYHGNDSNDNCESCQKDYH